VFLLFWQQHCQWTRPWCVII